ncbi:hypothetical protein EMIHUDRAFT_455603 [Emiliania huxleyi CCMP1516]|uniref:glycerol-3-phosphate dehydrogenase n=2 Tax=Emiliania huxleyi TaxID=2903 RepID=A0A0D3KFF7_EMIH1|nr:hypothetical protein EMIHUDRAFT_455603 [Emiliania huxleyi CCMP1516]EOD34492.1 hypothetical protein EMIHUDRAFT_455603 [Emiliania huxleyi CCMP1516]|eukprot:XP_005786921.1 hypothetical protein EMIHUDRAFT_455603 [Emiliania huxleyi CCMP1516]
MVLPRLTPLRGAAGLVVGGVVGSVLLRKPEENDFAGTPLKRKIQRFQSLVDRGQDPQSLRKRSEMVAALKSGEEFDVLIVGAGCTGAGAALDAATRGLKTACVERGDFANETSSRSSKLIWGGFKYLQVLGRCVGNARTPSSHNLTAGEHWQVAFAELLDRKTLTAPAPVSSLQKFISEFLMVYECCQERSWLAGQQPHLVEYIMTSVTLMARISRELRNSRGATMYFLPWLGNTVVGSTDKKCDATSSPHVTEDEIQYLVNEAEIAGDAASCLSSDIRLRRSDVISAWQGRLPFSAAGHTRLSCVSFICGGKWSTYRAMAEELIDKVVAFKGAPLAHAKPCVSKEIKLLGGDGFHSLLHVQLVQAYNVSTEVAKHLCHAYGTAAFHVCELAQPSLSGARLQRTVSRAGVPTDGGGHMGRRISPSYPYIEAEVLYACRHELAVSVKDMLTTRMRLAFLNSEAAKQAIPRVAALMAEELGWSSAEKARQIKVAQEYIGEFGGPVADKRGATLKAATFTDLHDIFLSVDKANAGYLDEKQLGEAAAKLGFPFRSDEHRRIKFKEADRSENGKLSEAEFIEWWNGRNSEKSRLALHKTVMLDAASEVAIDKSNASAK